MEKRKSPAFDSAELDGPIVSLPGNRKKGKTLEQYKDDTIGKPGTDERDLYEVELRMDIIQDLIKGARKKRNLSQQELGELVGVKKSQIRKREKGYNNTSIALLSRIFKALNAKIKISVELEDKEVELV